MTPARRAALLRLLEDWEAGLETPSSRLTNGRVLEELRKDLMVAWTDRIPGVAYTLTPAGIAAARREKDATTKDTPDA